jgi:UDP-3-O-[3-hydroxymyristoyl] N-acetylglucosamine deacetylase/3-hydroxyacyl-[acyl-carrier-protein] dehydratase
MKPDTQRTIGRDVTLDGGGVHSGVPASITFRPAPPGAGLRFRRMDLAGTPEIPADLSHVVDTHLGTSLADGEARVMTVEHVLAALVGARLDNVVMDLTGPEPPIRDGSFAEYLAALQEAGAVDQGEPARILELSEPVTARGGSGETYVAAPDEALRVSATIDFEHPAIGRLYGSFEITPQAFEREIAPARTFGFHADAEALRASSLAQGASLDNTEMLYQPSYKKEPNR